jgi:hypothetical protein
MVLEAVPQMVLWLCHVDSRLCREGKKMKLEDLTQDKLDEILSSIESSNETVKGLKADLTKAKAKARGADIDPALVQTLEAERDALQDQVVNLGKELKVATTASEKLQNQLNEESGFTQKLLVENGLNDALNSVGVKNPEFLKAVKSMFASQVKIVTEGDARVPKIGDKSFADYFPEWAKSDSGKNFIEPDNNTGGGAGGGDGKGAKAKTMSRAQFDGISPAQKMEFSKAGGTVI